MAAYKYIFIRGGLLSLVRLESVKRGQGIETQKSLAGNTAKQDKIFQR